jgi:hypothetical protein
VTWSKSGHPTCPARGVHSTRAKKLIHGGSLLERCKQLLSARFKLADHLFCGGNGGGANADLADRKLLVGQFLRGPEAQVPTKWSALGGEGYTGDATLN